CWTEQVKPTVNRAVHAAYVEAIAPYRHHVKREVRAARLPARSPDERRIQAIHALEQPVLFEDAPGQISVFNSEADDVEQSIGQAASDIVPEQTRPPRVRGQVKGPLKRPESRIEPYD